MESNKVDLFIATNSQNLPSEYIAAIRDEMFTLPDDSFIHFQTLNFKSPTIALVLSIVIGNFAVDRFYIGDVGLGLAKLLTCGGVGIWVLIDWFLIMNATKDKNMEQLNLAIARARTAS